MIKVGGVTEYIGFKLQCFSFTHYRYSVIGDQPTAYDKVTRFNTVMVYAGFLNEWDRYRSYL